MDKKRYKAIIYDIDGTLMDTYDRNMVPLRQIIKEELGEEWTDAQVRKFYAQPGLKTIRDLGIQDVEGVYARWVRYVNAYGRDAEPFEGIPEVLERFREANILQAVVSSKMRKQYGIDMGSRGMDKYMAAAVLAEDTQKHKPDPEPLLICLAKLGVETKDAIYIGDTASDSLAARNAGVDFGLAGWGAFSMEGFAPIHHYFAKPEDMLKLLE